MWLLLTAVLSCLLVLSLTMHLLRWVCPLGSVPLVRPEPRSYSYVPLNDINGVAAGKTGRRGFVLEDSDSEDEDDPTQREEPQLQGAGLAPL